ncbi:hypothetical protein HK104_005008 [Borealophlyctis nickersoniae]|nr:hypothetical protein HK104_005008 [Borealophlyctis nickersoniae]
MAKTTTTKTATKTKTASGERKPRQPVHGQFASRLQNLFQALDVITSLPTHIFLICIQKTELPKVKAAQPGLSHKEAFKTAAGNWKNAPENPINRDK